MTANDIAQAISALGLECSEVCIHSSVGAFVVPVERGAETITNAFLEKGSTIFVPAFSDQYEACPVPSVYAAAKRGWGLLLLSET